MKITNLIYIVLFTLLSLPSGRFGWTLGNKLSGQDIHFSQSTMTPLLLNPALTGVYGGDHRAFLNYKNQWSGMGGPGATYRTALFSYDTRLFKKQFHGGYVGAGILAYKDVAGDLKLGTTQLNISFSGVVYLNRKNLISGGLQGGYVQKSISTSAMQWDSQYDDASGLFNSSFPSNDVISIPPYHYGDFSAGLAWSYSANKSSVYAKKQLKFNLGVGAFHLNRPNQKLNPYITNTTDNLNSKIVVHGTGQIGIGSSSYELIPSAVLFMQGPSIDLNVGTMIRWLIKGESRYTGYVQGMALSVGAQYRVGDAVIPMMMFEYSNYALGVSYDVNTSGLIQGTHGRGGVEISVRYLTPNPFSRSSSRLLD